MNLNQMCRICGEHFKDKFEAILDHKEKVYKYLPIKNNEKGFPKNLCIDCLSSIINWNVFYNRCEEAQKKFAVFLQEKPIIDVGSRKDIVKTYTKKETPRNNNEHKKDENYEKNTSQSELSLFCNFCTADIKNQKHLNEHLVAAHCDLVFCCDLCKNYKPREDLITHMTEHALNSIVFKPEESKNSTTLEKFPCPECNKVFLTSSGLKYHVNTRHTPVNQFPCEQCDNMFLCKRVLSNHIKSVHSQERRFKCKTCDKRFKTDSTLYAHLKTHSKETPFKCFDCAKGFKFKHHLAVHSLQHKIAKERPFECGYCHKKFEALNNLTKHRKIHDKTSDFTCHICGVNLMQKRYLREHMKKVHRVR